MMGSLQALYRERPSADWIEVELLGRHRSGKLVLRELGKLWPGLMLAPVEDVRVPASAVVLQLEAA